MDADIDTSDTGGQEGWSFVDGATFILDVPDDIPALWGRATRCCGPRANR